MKRFFLLLLLVLPILSVAQPGTNSTCATALELEVSPTNVQRSLIPVDGQWYTTAVPEPTTACSGAGPATSAWYRFTAINTKHWIRTEGAGLGQESMEVFSGSCGALTSIGCFPANGPIPALTDLSVGGTYYLRVRMGTNSFCASNATHCQTWIGVVSPAPNDDCAGATVLPVIAGTTQAWPATEVSSLGATQSQAACSGNAAAANDDVWYRFTATATAHILATADLTGVQTNVFQWFSGGCGNLTSLACGQPMATGLTPGTEYHIRAHSQSTDPQVTMRALADVYAPAPNDECAGALPIAVTAAGGTPEPVNVSTIHGTASTVPCGSQPHDVWLTFTAPAATVHAMAGEAVHMALFSGSCGSLVCVSQGNANPNREFSGLTPGATYYLKVGSAVLTRMNTPVWVFAPVPNDACATAIALDVQDEGVQVTLGHTFHTSEYAWFTFTATHPRLVLEGGTLLGTQTLQAVVYSGDCASPVQVATSQNIRDPLVLTGLGVGQVYRVRVMAWDPMAFRLAVRIPVVNDDCEGAMPLPFRALADFPTIARETNMLAANGTGTCATTKDLWYRFTATQASACFVTPEAAGTTELFTGACGNLTSLGCTNNTIAAQFSGLVPGTEYRIRYSTTFQSHVPMLFNRPVNDEPDGALPAPFGSRFALPPVQFNSYGSTQSMPSHCSAYVPDTDTWFRFTATATAHSVQAILHNNHYTEQQMGQTLSTRIEVYDTLSTDQALLAAHLISCGDSPSALTGLVIGKEYLYRVYTQGSATNKARGFITAVSDQDNDDAQGALLLSYTDAYSAVFNTAGATQSLPGADCQVDDTADDDIWFKFVATNAPARIAVSHATADITLELFSGTPGNLTSLACDGNILELPALTNGQTYHVRLYSWNNATPVQGRIGLFTTPSLTANSCVDEDCLGPVLVPNPGIEMGGPCFIHISEIGAISGHGTLLAPGWPRMQSGSSDAVNSCAHHNAQFENPAGSFFPGEQRILSRSGKGMGGLFMSESGGLLQYVEYLQAPLSEPLIPGEPYLISFHAATKRTGLCMNGLGAALSEGPLPWGHGAPLEVQPDVLGLEVICTNNWTNICGVVVPRSPVDHITIGAFLNRGQVSTLGATGDYAYYFIDDVVVTRIDDPSCITGIGDIPSDEDGRSERSEGLRLYPNPANERVNIVGDAALFGKRAVVEVFDMRGARVHAEEVSWFQALQPLDLPAEWKDGLYLVMVRVEGQAPKAARLVVRR